MFVCFSSFFFISGSTLSSAVHSVPSTDFISLLLVFRGLLLLISSLIFLVVLSIVISSI